MPLISWKPSVAAGHVTLSEAAEIGRVIDAYVRAYQTAELDDRVARVERLATPSYAYHDGWAHR